MFKRIAKIFIVTVSILFALGVSALWIGGLPGHGNNCHGISYHAGDFADATGGNLRMRALGSFAGVITVLDYQRSIPPHDPVGPAIAGLRKWDFDDAGARYLARRPNWEFGGFELRPCPAPGWGGFEAIIPDWFLILLGLAAPIAVLWRSPFRRQSRRALAGRCGQCAVPRPPDSGPCPECGAEPSLTLRLVARLGKFHWFCWWIPALAFYLCAVAGQTMNPYTAWTTVFVIAASIYMLGVAAIRFALTGNILTAGPPRGFDVVMKPAPGVKGETSRPGP